LKSIRGKSRWTSVTAAAVVVAAAAVSFIAVGPGGGARLTAASSAASSGNHGTAAANAVAADPAASQSATASTGATAGLGATASPGAAASQSATAGSSAPPIGLYGLTTVPYASTGPGGSLHGPQGVSVRNGVVYVSHTGANVVAAIKDGQTTLVAGSLTGYGEHGDGGPATSATL
jgi:hypothetical protein